MRLATSGLAVIQHTQRVRQVAAEIRLPDQVDQAGLLELAGDPLVCTGEHHAHVTALQIAHHFF
jgi:hypothetical protein